MGALPKPSKPFVNVGIGHFGSFDVKLYRQNGGQKFIKDYICLPTK